MKPVTEPTCDLVAERVALGVPLAELAEHATSCARCRLVVALPARLGSAHAAVDPGLGFAARMTAGAQHRITVRRKRRVAGSAAAAVAACALAVVAVAHVGSAPTVAVTAPQPTVPAPIDQPAMKDIWDAQEPALPPRHVDPDVRALVHLADIDRDLRGTARWARIERPLRPYRSLVQGVKP
jgi:hypothetical protein